MGIIAPSMTSFYRQQTANIKAQSAGVNSKIASNNTGLNSIRAAIAADNARYAATHSSSSSTTNSSSKTSSGGTGTTSTTTNQNPTPTTSYTYAGGNQNIANYNGAQITYNAPYRGVNFNGSTFQFNSGSGTLTVGNVTNKIVDFRNSSGGVLAKAYAAGHSGAIDGRNFSGYQFLVGSATGSNDIYAGSSGSYLWGNAGNIADTLTGGAGGDAFFVGKTDGSDTIKNASANDSINLYNVTLRDIINATENSGTIGITLNTGNTVRVQSNGNLSARFNLADGLAYSYNHATKSWQGA